MLSKHNRQFTFQLTTSRGGRQGVYVRWWSDWHFNSRPHEEVDECGFYVTNDDFISTHDLTRRSTEALEIGLQDFDISTHDLTRRSTCSDGYFLGVEVISTHDLTRRSTPFFVGLTSILSFQLTTSRGGRPIELGNRNLTEHFNSRPHEEVDPNRSKTFAYLSAFQLTTSRGGRHINTVLSKLNWYFNSRPHEEVDANVFIDCGKSVVFQLTTSRGGRLLELNHKHSIIYFNSRPHEEVDMLSLMQSVKCGTFQLTTSRGGRLNLILSTPSSICISTHDLTRRSTVTSPTCTLPYLVFQLTTSRGGRQMNDLSQKIDALFQLTTSRGGRHLLRWT